MTIYKKLFIVFVLFIPQLLMAKVWVKTPEMPFSEFKAYIESLGPSHKSYAQNLFQQKRNEAKAFDLKAKLLKAQQLWLSGTGELATNAFQQITKLALKADWDKEERRIILYSYLRLAQNESDPEKQKALLISASAFAPFLINQDNYPDHKYFPPPLIEKLVTLQQNTNKLRLNWKSIFPYHEIILINGRVLEKQQKIAQAFYRVTALSSSHQVWSKNINLSDLMNQKIKTKSLSLGPCKNPQLANKKLKHVSLLPFSNCPTNQDFVFHQEFMQTQEDALTEDKKFWTKKSLWIAIGTGVVVLSLIFLLHQDKGDEGDKKPNSPPAGDYFY